MEPIRSLLRITESRPSKEISRTTPAVPDEKDAAILSGIIDRARLSKGWNRLPQGKVNDEGRYVPGEQDAAIITWYEILVDEGVPRGRWNDCYRAAQHRRNELKAQGKPVEGIVEPGDLVVEWLKIKDLHDELDRSRLLPENAAAACERCTRVGEQYLEVLPDGAVGGPCDHRPLTDEERAANTKIGLDMLERARRQAEETRQARLRAERLAEDSKPKFINVRMECNQCRRRVDNPMGQSWKDGDACGVMLPNGSQCEGHLYEYKRLTSPV